jgi:hypothetical protein
MLTRCGLAEGDGWRGDDVGILDPGRPPSDVIRVRGKIVAPVDLFVGQRRR